MSALAAAPTGGAEAEVDKGKLFELPAIEIDESNPTQITVAFSGSVVLDRSQASDAKLYNDLKAGKLFSLTVDGLVKGARKTHRRDNDGNIDAVAETKTLVIDSITVDG